MSQTIDPGETLSDVATSLVADLSGLTNDAGDPLGLSGEVVTVDDGFGGVQTSLQITSTDGSSLGSLSCRIWKIFRSRRAPFRRTSLWRRWRSRRMRRFDPVSLQEARSVASEPDHEPDLRGVFVEVYLLVLRSAGPITTDLDFEDRARW